MRRQSIAGLDRRQLRTWLAGFFLALLVPAAVLVYQAYSQLKWESFYQYRLQAGELQARVDERLAQLVDREQARSFADYAFLISRDEAANYVQRSVLAEFPVATDIPGLIGYFQVDSQGVFSTPLVPSGNNTGIPEPELLARKTVADKLLRVLTSNQLASPGKGTLEKDANLADLRQSIDDESSAKARFDSASAPAGALAETIVTADNASDAGNASDADSARDGSASQAAFDRLAVTLESGQKRKVQNLGRVEELQLDQLYQDKAEIVQLQEPKKNVAPEAEGLSAPRVSTFESEIDGFEFSMLDSGHLVLFRKVWRNGERLVQGLLIAQEPFVENLLATPFRDSNLFAMSNLVVAYHGDVQAVVPGALQSFYPGQSAAELTGSLLYRSKLTAPLGGIELLFSLNRLPAGPGAPVLGWTAALLFIVLIGGFTLLYRLGGAQIDLTRQQQDFVSAMSHELKTPLTSIRMYGEMLREGWVSEDNKKAYYEFIHKEGERLSRLIDNVLQLARMTRSDLDVDLHPVTVAEVMDVLVSKVTTQVEQAGFTLDVTIANGIADAQINVDLDHFVQVTINLVDNALKFSATATDRRVTLQCTAPSTGEVRFSVRDYGPGIEPDQLRKIFRLFYRSASELTRETVGTGIGLALVQQLAAQMQAKVDVVNKVPGAEFDITFRRL